MATLDLAKIMEEAMSEILDRFEDRLTHLMMENRKLTNLVQLLEIEQIAIEQELNNIKRKFEISNDSE